MVIFIIHPCSDLSFLSCVEARDLYLDLFDAGENISIEDLRELLNRHVENEGGLPLNDDQFRYIISGLFSDPAVLSWRNPIPVNDILSMY